MNPDIFEFPGGQEPGGEPLERKQVNVRGRREHEAFLKDPQKCKEYGLDIVYETMVYLKRWGGWLDEQSNEEEK